MRYLNISFLGAMVCICFAGCNSLETSLAHTEGHPSTQSTQPTTMLEQRDDDILSRDYAVAEKALNKAVLEKNHATIRRGLENPILPIQQKTAEAISEIDDETFVPNLIIALRKNQSVMAGGSEIRGLQNKLDLTLIAALEKLTKIEFGVSEKLSTNDIEGVIKKSEEWWAKRQR